MKKQFLKGLMILTTALLFAACKDGEPGPEGNANVMQINYGSKTFTGAADYVLPANITQGMIDSSLVLAYYNPSSEAATAWYAIPGMGSSGLYNTRYLLFQNASKPTYRVILMKPDGSGGYANAVTFTKLKIIITPASKIINGVNVNDYQSVKKAYALEE